MVIVLLNNNGQPELAHKRSVLRVGIHGVAEACGGTLWILN